MAKDFFSSSKIALVLSLVLTAIGFFFFRFEPIVLGVLIGAAVSSALCLYPDKAIRGSLMIQTILIFLAASDCSSVLLYLLTVLMIVAAEYTQKDVSRTSACISAIIAALVTLFFGLAGIGIEYLL